MERTLEPEVMDDPAQARAYAAADFAAVNQGFVERLRATFPELVAGRVVDLGCGPADIIIRLCRALPGVTAVGVDASGPMLELGRAAVAEAGLTGRIELLQAYLPGLPLPAGAAAAVISNSLLHHLPRPEPFWAELTRLGAPGAPVLVMDLFRPPSAAEAERIVAEAGVSDDPILLRDFTHSLHAAFTLDEVRAQLRAAGLPLQSAVISERHWAAWGRLP